MGNRRTSSDSQAITLTRPQAAALCGLTPAGFDVWVRKGIVPTALPGTRRWSRVALERAVAGGPTPIDVEVDPYLEWEAEHSRETHSGTRSFRTGLLPAWDDDTVLDKPIGKRELEAMADIHAGDGREMQDHEVRGGPSTFSKMAIRGYLVSTASHPYKLKLTPEGVAAYLAAAKAAL